MKNIFVFFMVGMFCFCCETEDSASTKETKQVNKQQEQYAIAQPVPVFDYSLERDLLIQLYKIRNQKVATHSVWRSDHGVIEDDCPSMGYGLPYDVSLTNPLMATDEDQDGWNTQGSLTSVGQAEPNGVFASTNTSATWVMCVGKSGLIEPVYVETRVTAYPYPIVVDYETNRVKRAGKSTVNITVRK